MISVSGISQNKSKETQIDSIQSVIQSANHDTTKINAWFSWANLVRKTDRVRFGHLIQKIEDLTIQNLLKESTLTEEVFYKQAKRKVFNIRGDQARKIGDYGEAIKFYKGSLEINTDLQDQAEIANSYNNIGIVHGMQANYDECKKYMLKSLEIHKNEGNSKGVASSYNNLGNINYYQGDYKSAIEYWLQSLEAKRESGDKIGMANTINNIGNIYLDLKDYDLALDYYNRSLDLYKELDNLHGIGTGNYNLSNVYQKKGDLDKALEALKISLEIHTKSGNKRGIADAKNGIGSIYNEKGDNVKAKRFFEESLSLHEEINSQKGIAVALNNLGIICFEEGNNQKALQFSLRSLELGKKIGSVQRMLDASETLWKIYKKMGNSTQALIMYELYTESKDSLSSEDKRMEIIRAEIEYEYSKQIAADSIRTAEEAKVKDAQILAEQAENREKEKQQYFLFGILGLALVFVGFIYNRFRITSKQKDIIEDQKKQVDVAFQELETKNGEILDSIVYAKRIQYAILPPKSRIQKLIPDSFVFYRPKDIVAGDFYWLEKKDDKILVAACDCTGHGVPGAMVSVVCNNGLNRAVREHGLTNPGKILDKTREIVIEEFQKSEEDKTLANKGEGGIKDGMDVAIVSIEQEQENSVAVANPSKLSFAGAHNPLWIIRKGGNEIEEYKANKQPIGKFRNPSPYDTHQIELNSGDTLYLCTDGFSDQFGGPKRESGGKKYKTKYFKKFLLSIKDKSMQEQGALIEQEFESWRGDLNQLDDVCVIGIRI